MAIRLASLIVTVSYAPTLILGLDNGLAITPPMGFNTFVRYGCTTDCTKYPNECISEGLIKRIANLMVDGGYRDCGYNYITIDNCWQAKTRDVNGRLQPDPERFPSGMKHLADYLHERNLYLGLFTILAEATDQGYPGTTRETMELDADTLAEWGVDYVKVVSTNLMDPRFLDEKFTRLGCYLNGTGRPMVYSCSYPVFQIRGGVPVDWSEAASICNTWRVANDVKDSWEIVEETMDAVAYRQNVIAQYAGPGHFNDPDSLVIGNFGLSLDQCQSQMAVWAIIAAPLIMSADIATIRPEFKEVLQNKLAIRISQDPTGNQGKRICTAQSIDVWTCPITPIKNGQYSYAVAFVSRRSDGTPYPYKITLAEMGLNNPNGYAVYDVYNNTDYSDGEILSPCTEIDIRINPSGCVFQYYEAQE